MKSLSLFFAWFPLVGSLVALGCSGGSDSKDDHAGAGAPAVLVSNTPGVDVIDVGSPATPDLVLLSSNLVQSKMTNMVFQQWLGEIKNNGATPACAVRIEGRFATSNGIELTRFTGYAEGEPYSDTGAVTIGCIPPGKIASFYANTFSLSLVPLESVRALSVKLSPVAYDGAVPNIDVPTLSTTVAPVFPSEYGIRGSMVGGPRIISNIRADFYPRNSAGLVLAQLTSVDLDSLSPGASFDVSTSGIETAFTQYRSFVSFIDQAADARRILGSGSPSATEKAAAAVQTYRQETQARAARFRSSAR